MSCLPLAMTSRRHLVWWSACPKWKTIGALLLVTVLGNFLVIHIHQLRYRYSNITPSSFVHNSQSYFHNMTGNHVMMTSQVINASSSDKIDWNNYTLMNLDLLRRGPGEQGKALEMNDLQNLTAAERELERHLYNLYQFNAFVSSKISPQRSIGDLRDEVCRRAKFSKRIPANSVSIIIPFFNEHTSTVFRTISSIVNRTPSNLIREIILVDDFSSMSRLKSPLEDFIAKNEMNNKVRILRNKKRLGLISSRIAGADASTGRFLVFLEAHMEVNYNFLPPLLEPILLDNKTVTCPVVDNIDRRNFGIARIDYERNAFQWNLQNEHFRVFPQDLNNLPAPFPTPVMMGGAFAMDRKWWETLGKYDPELEIWGGEQYELSFKIWMCGGKLLNVPCSRVAHVFKFKLPYPVGEKYSRNLKRVTSVWMDDYKEYVYKRLPGVRSADPGNDLRSRFELRQRLKCKNFDWFMKNVAFDVLYNFPVIEPPSLAWGTLRPTNQREYCVKLSPQDQNHDYAFVDKSCQHSNGKDFKFEYSWRKIIREMNGIRCLETRTPTIVSVHYWRLNATVQQFVWNRPKGWIVNVKSALCLHWDDDNQDRGGGGLDMRLCADQPSFSWTFEHFDPLLVDAEWEKYTVSRKEKNNSLQ